MSKKKAAHLNKDEFIGNEGLQEELKEDIQDNEELVENTTNEVVEESAELQDNANSEEMIEDIQESHEPEEIKPQVELEQVPETIQEEPKQNNNLGKITGYWSKGTKVLYNNKTYCIRGTKGNIGDLIDIRNLI